MLLLFLIVCELQFELWNHFQAGSMGQIDDECQKVTSLYRRLYGQQKFFPIEVILWSLSCEVGLKKQLAFSETYQIDIFKIQWLQCCRLVPDVVVYRKSEGGRYAFFPILLLKMV